MAAGGHSSVMEEGGFTIVRRGATSRSSAAPGRHRVPIQRASPMAASAVSAAELAALAQRIDAAVEELRGSALLARLRATLGSLARPACNRSVPRAVVCLGLGSFGSAAAPRYQMALALLLREEFLGGLSSAGAGASAGSVAGDDANESCSGAPRAQRDEAAPGGATRATASDTEDADPPFCAYDPVFDALEVAFLESRGCAVLWRNREGRHLAQGGCTLFFMPHCGRELYSNLLGANWGAAPLSQLLVLGNSFRAYAGGPGTEVAAAWSPLFRALQIVSEVSIGPAPGTTSSRRGDSELFANAFNNTSLHAFADETMRDLPSDWWERSFEPTPAGEPLLGYDIVGAPDEAGSS